MLTSLAVRNLVVIPELEITFAPGLTVISGESGAGKSVLLEALSLALGARAASDRIRPGTARAEARAAFAIAPGSEAAAFLSGNELADPDEPGLCRTRRTLDREGRSRAFVNDTPVTRRTLAELGGALLDIHSQDGSTRLLQRTVQRQLLDDFAGAKPRLEAAAEAWRAWREAEAALAAARDVAAGGPEQQALRAYQLAELDALDPGPDEYEALEAEHRRLADVDRLRGVAAEALQALEDCDGLRRAARELASLDDVAPDLRAAQGSLDDALNLLADAGIALRRYADELEPDPARLAALDARLGTMHDLARKHRVAPQNLPGLRAHLTEETALRKKSGERLRSLEKQREYRQRVWHRAAKVLGDVRRRAAPGFAHVVGQRMRTLGIAAGQLEVVFGEAESEHGLESVALHISTHPDHPPAPLARVASGGERARVALAISVTAAERSPLPCLVLDEADIGVGGATADVVGRMLRKLAETTQVICITHAPQVAALGHHHLRAVRAGAGCLEIEHLSNQERMEELARMLSGAGVTDRARAHARELLGGKGTLREFREPAG